MAKKLVSLTGKGNVGGVISSVKKDEPKFDEVFIVNKKIPTRVRKCILMLFKEETLAELVTKLV